MNGVDVEDVDDTMRRVGDGMGWRGGRHGGGGLARVPNDGRKVLVLADSKVAIAAVRKAGKRNLVT